MRQNTIVALLAVTCGLLAANLVVSLRTPAPFPMAFGQAGGNVVMAGANSQNDPYCFIFDAGKQKLTAYTVRGKSIDWIGVRDLRYDFTPSEYPTGRGKTSVKNMKKLVTPK
jgi:hypothetical protein